MMKFEFTASEAGAEVRLREKRTIGWRTLPPDKWPDAADHLLAPALRLLQKLRASGIATDVGDAVHVPTADLLETPNSILTMLDLPPLAPLSLGLTLRGSIERADGFVQMRWTDEPAREVSPKRSGLIVEYGGKVGRLTPILVSLLSAVESYNATIGHDTDNRLPVWMGVQTALGGIAGPPVNADRLLKSFRIYQAGAFALDIKESLSGPDFDPIPMARAMRPSIADETVAPEDGVAAEDEVRDADEHALLPPELQREFQRAFKKDGLDTPPAYVLARNTYLVIDRDVQRALDVVKAVKRSSPTERRAFVRNPRAVLAAAILDAGEAASSLFVETRQYSERVLGLGLWQPPALDWIKRQPNGWLPETFAFAVGETTLTLTPDSFERLGESYDTACAEDQATFRFDGQELSVADAAAAFDRVRRDGVQPESEPTPESEPSAEPDTSVLLIEENIETDEFRRSIRPRPLFAQKLFPSDLVVTEPKPHQVDGFGWLVDTWTAGLPGALLADDMGLGKTMQALAFLVWVRENLKQADERARQLRGPVLIVAPPALLRNWQSEAERHLGPSALGTCLEVFGRGLSRLKKPGTAPEDAIDVDALRDADWILTTYETVADYHRAFARVGFSVAVFDEMQKVKAPNTINTHAAKTINADFVLGMTGTPIENRIEDLWCIMDRVAPGFLGALKPFSKRFGENDPAALATLKKKLDAGVEDVPPIMLRRMKHDHLRGLPDRTFRTYQDPTMPREQAAAYQQVVNDAMTGAGQKEILRVIHALRGISLHPFGADEVDPYDPASAAVWIEQSARIKQVVAILLEIQSKREKALVFIEDRAIQAAFARIAAARLQLSREPEIINGVTTGDERQAIVDRFQARPAGFDFLVLSPKAAGIGLTITAANHVIHLSRWWNPAVEDQCNDRVFRIGQDKPVTVHIPMAVHPRIGADSFDLKLNALLERKRRLSRDMLAPPVSDSDASVLFEQTIGGSARR